MLGGRSRLPVLAEIAGPDPGRPGAWSLRRQDLERLGSLHDRIESSRVVLVTGGEEVTGVLATALAGAAAAAGRRTVLVECDLARPRMAADLGLSASPGLHEYLRREAASREVLQSLVPGGPAAAAADGPLVCVTAGRGADDPASLLGLEGFHEMASKLRVAYELVVIWGPPLAAADGGSRTAADGGDGTTADRGIGAVANGGAGVAADSGLGAVAAECDGILAALGPEATSRRASRAVRAALRRLPVAAFGAVVVGAR